MQVGFHGKLPCNGDFLRRRVPQEFLDWWDQWLQGGVLASRQQLGDAWLDIFLTSPAWRFFIGEHDSGARACAGLLVPSVDRVGRYFPLTLVWFPPPGRTLFSLARQAAPWFDAAERLVMEALQAERLDFEAFDRQIEATASLLDAVRGPDDFTLHPDAAAPLLAGQSGDVQLPLAGLGELRAVAEHLAGSLLRQAGRRCCFWTEGSERVAPSLLASAGLPAAADFSALLTGEWSGSTWTPLAASFGAPAPPAATTLRPALPLVFASASASEVGHQRRENQDAVLERAELGLWAVADGMGGHSDGQLASRAVCDALAGLLPPPSIDRAVEAIRDQLAAVNDYLHRISMRPVDPKQCGSTVVVLLVREGEAALLWAGDSRLYRLRGGELVQLSTDHSWDADGNAGEGTAITRAVGGAPQLELEVLHQPVLPGDRYLLCSDGVTRELDDLRLQQLLSGGDAAGCCRGLMRALLATPARDNASAVVVDVLLDSSQEIPA